MHSRRLISLAGAAWFWALVLMFVVSHANGTSDVSGDATLEFGTSTGTLWAPFLEWELENASFAGNPFDVAADVRFTHNEAGITHETQMFYAGSDVWRFRFTGTRTGEWVFETSSDDPDLDGRSGFVVIEPNPDPDIHGFLVADNNRFAVQVGEDGALRGTTYNVYYNHPANLHIPGGWEGEGGFPVGDRAAIEEKAAAVLDEVTEHGADAMFLHVTNELFQYGARAHDEHDSETPDPDTFEVLEMIITRAHKRSLHVHMWLWGDEQRRQTPVGLPGGINGRVDQRMQRYIAARLGPLPGWTMSYGFDLNEWVTPAEVGKWHDYMHEHIGWPRLLMARETQAGHHDPFELGVNKLDVYSSDERPSSGFYDLAVDLLQEGYPLVFERRFLHSRDDVWDMDTTRRAWWQFALAGGAGAVWGVKWADPSDARPYPNPEQLRTFRTFWRDRFLLDLKPATELTDGYALKVPGGDLAVFYKESTSSVELDLSAMSEALTGVAVDTKLDYLEIELGDLAAEPQVWSAPYESDWAIAIGVFDAP